MLKAVKDKKVKAIDALPKDADEVDAAVFMAVLYGYILAIATLIRPNEAHTKNFYTQLMSARRLACGGGLAADLCHVSTPNGL